MHQPSLPETPHDTIVVVGLLIATIGPVLAMAALVAVLLRVWKGP